MSHLASKYVEETSFGVWFLRTHVWQERVLGVAIGDLERLIDAPLPMRPVLLDAGCGQGKSFPLRAQAFGPGRLIGLDADRKSLANARAEADHAGLAAEVVAGDCARIPLPADSVDMVFCHQTFDHLVEQEKALAEFYRVLKPGGLLLFAESTAAYIDTWLIRWLFRHPMEVQKSAAGYLGMLRAQGFEFGERNVSYPDLWWSRAKDFGCWSASIFGSRLLSEYEKRPS